MFLFYAYVLFCVCVYTNSFIMSSNIIQFRNCRLVRNNALITEDLWVRDGHIINPESVFFDEKICAHQQVDCAGAIIAPGFIDIQINGTSGAGQMAQFYLSLTLYIYFLFSITVFSFSLPFLFFTHCVVVEYIFVSLSGLRNVFMF